VATGMQAYQQKGWFNKSMIYASVGVVALYASYELLPMPVFMSQPACAQDDD